MAVDKTKHTGSSSNKKSYGVLKQQNVHKTTIRKVSARKASSTHKKRTVSNNVEVRKNLLTDEIDGSVTSSAESGFVRPIQQSLFESGNKATILANFEEWIKLATDNKINVKNSWNFALIDYFHDLTVLKENNGNINFQKASATLDGCVKIYASRIDSVVNEAGKLLSGIVTANDNSNRASSLQMDSVNGTISTNANTTGIPVQEGDVMIDPQTGLPISVVNDNQQMDITSKRRVNNRVLETTLTNFENIKLSSFEEEFSIDPLFKKALADFDEAGAKNLLLSILHIQRDARVVFDSAKEYVAKNEMSKDIDSDKDVDMEDNTESTSNGLKPAIQLVYKGSDTEEEQLKIIDDNLLELGTSLNILSTTIPQKKLCSSLGLIRDSIQDITKVKDLIDSIGQEGSLVGELASEHVALGEKSNVDNFEQFELNEASLIDNNNVDVQDDDIAFDDEFENVNTEEYEQKAEQVFADDVNERVLDDSDESEENFDLDFEKNLFSEFDGVFNNKAWTGKDHWKVKNIKKANASIIPPITDNNEGSSDGQSDVSKTSNSKSKRVRNKKLRTQIDLSDWSVADETVLKQAEAEKVKNERSIDIPIKNRKDPYYNLLPTDYHVTLEKMTVLFTRPQQKGNFFRKPIKHRSKWKDNDEHNDLHGTVSEGIDKSHEQDGEQQYWADMYEDLEAPEDLDAAEDINSNQGNISMNLDMNNGLDFNDALGNDNEMMHNLSLDDEASKHVDENGLALNAGFMLSSIDTENERKPEANTLKTLLQMNATQKVMYSRVAKKVDIKKLKDNIWRCIENQLTKLDSSKGKQLQFSSIIKQLKTLYTFDTLKDLSTSFCFICLLHLANEHGFRIDKDEVNLQDLTIVF
ncbi:hypothetical protein ACO0OL_001969 [Hanseniaspora opuntiae]